MSLRRHFTLKVWSQCILQGVWLYMVSAWLIHWFIVFTDPYRYEPLNTDFGVWDIFVIFFAFFGSPFFACMGAEWYGRYIAEPILAYIEKHTPR